MRITPFNKPFFSGNELRYIKQAVNTGKISGNGSFTKRCNDFFEKRFQIKKALLTTSCTDALEMCALLAKIEPGDEVIVPSFTFVSTALAFVRQGARITFADSRSDIPNINVKSIEHLINHKTKAIVAVHYAGVACEMDDIIKLAEKHNLIVIEDAAQAIDSYYKGRPLGSIGHLSAFSFHETKNINCGEGGLLGINDDRFIKRAEIVWEKGTNRAEFFRGEVNKYGWVDIGSSFLPSEITAAFLWAQLEKIAEVQAKRKKIWNTYSRGLSEWASSNGVQLPFIPDYATNNAHMFYLICESLEQREHITERLKSKGIQAVFHYLSLHRSNYYSDKHDGRVLLNSDKFSDRLLRLPFYFSLNEVEINRIIDAIVR